MAGALEKLFAMARDVGFNRAVRLAQQACRLYRCDVPLDGVLGPETVEALATIPEDVILRALCSEQARHYKARVAAKPSLAPCLPAWLKKARFMLPS